MARNIAGILLRVGRYKLPENLLWNSVLPIVTRNSWTFTLQKYISESDFSTLLQKIVRMLRDNDLGDTFRSRATGAALAAALLLASFGNAATAQDQIARAPAGQPVVTQSVGKPVLLRRGPGFGETEANLVARFLIERGCPTTVTTERGLPKRVTVEVGAKKFAFTQSGSAGASALGWCLDRS